MLSIDLQHHLPDRRRLEVEVVDLPIHRVTQVVIDVDHRTGKHRIAGPLHLGALHGEERVVGAGIIGWQVIGHGHSVGAWDVVERAEETVAHLHARLLAHRSDEALQGQTAAQRVAVGIPMRGDEKVAAASNALGDLARREVRRIRCHRLTS